MFKRNKYMAQINNEGFRDRASYRVYQPKELPHVNRIQNSRVNIKLIAAIKCSNCSTARGSLSVNLFKIKEYASQPASIVNRDLTAFGML